MHLPIYIKKVTEKSKFEHIIKTFSGMTKTAPCSVENLEKCGSREEMLTKVSLAILSRKRKNYVREIEQGVSITGYIFSEKEYYILMTADVTVPLQNKVLIECMGFARPEIIHLYKADNLPHSDMVEYYREVMPKEAITLDERIPSKRPKDAQEITDTFYFSDSLNEAVKEYMKRPTKSLKTLVTLVWGRLLCDFIGNEQIFIKSVHEGGRLTASPIVFNNELNNVEAYKSILAQYQKAERFDNYGLDAIANAVGYDFEMFAPMVLDFENDRKYVTFIDKMDTDILYVIRAHERETAPLVVLCDLVGSDLSVTYKYCPECFSDFEDFDIYNLHNSFMRIMEQIIFGEERTVKSNVRAGYSIEKVREAKRSVLKKLSLFEGYTEKEEIETLIDKLEIVHCTMQDELCCAGQIVSGLFIPLTGKIEVCARDDEMVYNPLMILKEGKLFGAELLRPDRKALATYRVASNDSLLIYIRTSALMEEVTNHPELIAELVDSICERLDRFQKLWILNS